MNKKQSLVAKQALKKTALTLGHLEKIFIPNSWMLVGGLPLRIFEKEKSGRLPESSLDDLNDLDIITISEKNILPLISQYFEILHYHQGPLSLFYYQLKDKRTKILIDIFADDPQNRQRQKVKFESLEIIAPTVADMLLKKYDEIISCLSQNHNLKPKHLLYVNTLQELEGEKDLVKLWQKRHKQKKQGIYNFSSFAQVKKRFGELVQSRKYLVKEIRNNHKSYCLECQNGKTD